MRLIHVLLFLIAACVAKSQFTFTDIPFLAQASMSSSVSYEPNINDTNLIAWWITTNNAVNNSGVVKTNFDATVNAMHFIGFGASSFAMYMSRSDGFGNYVDHSGDLTQSDWSTTLATVNSANSWTPTAQNGIVVQSFILPRGQSFVFEFLARLGTGNQTIQWYSNGSSFVSFTLEATNQLFSFPLIGGAGSLSFGWRDNNAAGFGTIIVEETRMIQTQPPAWETNYVQSLGTGRSNYPGLNGERVLQATELINGMATTTNVHFTTPFTWYCLMKSPLMAAGEALFWTPNTASTASFTTNGHALIAVNNTSVRLMGGGLNITNSGAWITNEFNLVAVVCDGANSLIRINDNIVTGSVNPVVNGHGWAWNMSSVRTDIATGGSRYGAFAEQFIYKGADSLETITNRFSYLKQKFGL